MSINPLKKGDGNWGKTLEKKLKGKINSKKKRKKKEHSYQSSVKGIRLTTSPCTSKDKTDLDILDFSLISF